MVSVKIIHKPGCMGKRILLEARDTFPDWLELIWCWFIDHIKILFDKHIFYSNCPLLL